MQLSSSPLLTALIRGAALPSYRRHSLLCLPTCHGQGVGRNKKGFQHQPPSPWGRQSCRWRGGKASSSSSKLPSSPSWLSGWRRYPGDRWTPAPYFHHMEKESRKHFLTFTLGGVSSAAAEINWAKQRWSPKTVHKKSFTFAGGILPLTAWKSIFLRISVAFAGFVV